MHHDQNIYINRHPIQAIQPEVDDLLIEGTGQIGTLGASLAGAIETRWS